MISIYLRDHSKVTSDSYDDRQMQNCNYNFGKYLVDEQSTRFVFIYVHESKSFIINNNNINDMPSVLTLNNGKLFN